MKGNHTCLTLSCRQSLDNSAASLLEQQKLEILTFSWNVNEQKPAGSAFFNKVSKLAASDSVKLAVFGLQEIEMGGGSVAMAAAKDALHKKAQVHIRLLVFHTARYRHMEAWSEVLCKGPGI